MSAASQMPAIGACSWSVLGTPLLATTYDDLAARCRQWTRENRVVGVGFMDAHIVTRRRREPAFRDAGRTFDCFIPDGAPLAWCLRFAGANIRRTVTAPAFMGKVLAGAAGPSTHYLLGGSPECGRRLREKFAKSDADVRIVGGYHGNCSDDGVLQGSAEAEVMEEINALAPDYIWLGFGAMKQVLWFSRHKHLLRRGIVLTVGFAFDVNAGIKRDAPQWMQTAGLNWLYRLCSEPKRLASRYFQYIPLFLSYLVGDALRGCAIAKPARLVDESAK